MLLYSFLVTFWLLLATANCDNCQGLAGGTDYRSLFGLTESNEDLSSSGLAVSQDDGSTITRLKHTVNGIEVYGSGATVFENTEVHGLCSTGPEIIFGTQGPKLLGSLSRSLAGAFSEAQTAFSDSSIAVCKAHWQVSPRDKVTNATAKRYVYPLDSGSVTQVDKVELLGHDGDRDVLFRVFCIVDVIANNTIRSWDGLQFYFGKGGNSKTRQYNYGSDRPRLPATPASTTGRCNMRNPSGTVFVHDMVSSSKDISRSSTPVAVYPCQDGANDAINGAFSPLNDCFFNADLTARFLLDPQWGLFTDLGKYTPGGVFHVGAHFKQRYENAFWDGNALYIGDGATTFLPLCTCTDVIAHEIGHSVTQMFSDLAYEGESGCMNEAFSDMMGEAVENYFKNGTNDFKIGTECMKSQPYLRDMTRRVSYKSFMPDSDPHECSAIYNYAFYKLATYPGWSTQSAFRVFLMANALFWRQNTGMKQAACDVAAAASKANMGLDMNGIVSAFSAIDIDISRCMPTTGGGNGGRTTSTTSTTTTTQRTRTTARTTSTFFPTFFPPRTTTTSSRRQTTTTSFTYPTFFPPSNRWTTSSGDDGDTVVTLNNCSPLSGLSAYQGEMKFFKVLAPSDAITMDISIDGPNGDADMYVKVGSLPTLRSYDWRPYLKGSFELVHRVVTQTGPYYVMINAAKGYNNLELQACFI